MITLDEGVTDEQGVTPKPGVSGTRNITAGDNLIAFLLLQNGDFFVQEDGVSKFKLERFVDG
jgi:hypothetical protein